MTAAATKRAASGRSLEVPGVTHGTAPIPMGARVGNVIYSSGVLGKDPTTDTLPASAEAQARLAFDNVIALLAGAGATLEHVVRMTVYIKEESARAAVNEQWVRHFPDPHDRPARHTLKYDLPAGMLLQLEVVAVLPTT